METKYDRTCEIEAFEETKEGVKGLVDSGITNIPRFFHHQPEHDEPSIEPVGIQIPVIDLSGVDSKEQRKGVIEEVKSASQTMGFFQVVNHGVPLDVLDEMLLGIRQFNESDSELKKIYYSTNPGQKFTFRCNFDLLQAPAGNWRDTMRVRMRPDPPKQDELPPQCRERTFEFVKYMEKLGIILFQLLSEALDLETNHLIDIECNEALNIVSNYYPPCPQPNLTIGAAKHTDPDFLTVLLQDDIEGLQVYYEKHWINVPPLRGALVVNIGDLLQLVTNDKFKSVEHKVLARKDGPARVSVACFFNADYTSERLYGPIKELISDDNPALYKEITSRDFVKYYRRSLMDKLRLHI